MLSHHSETLASRWGTFSLGRQLIMIANELNRAGHWMQEGDTNETRLCYERALDLLYLTIRNAHGHALLRELCRAKEFLLMLYGGKPALKEHTQLQNAVIALSPESYTLLNPRK